jgi:hypothetical protein
VLLLTDEDDFNALASVLLTGNVEGRVYRLAPPLHSHGVVAPYTSGEILFRDGLTRQTFSGRYHEGARIVAQPANGLLPAGHDLLFLVPRTASSPPSRRPLRRRRTLVTPW